MAITRLQQARQMYALGQLVSKTMDGSRPGYRGDHAYGGGDQVAGGGDHGFGGGDGPPGPDDRSTAQQTANTRAAIAAAQRENRIADMEKFINRPPNIFQQIGTGIGNYIKGGGMIGMIGRGLGSLFSSLTGPKATEYGNLDIPGYNMLNIAGPVTAPPDKREGGDNDNENRNLYATTNQYTIPTDVEEEGITTLVNNPDFFQRYRGLNQTRQDKLGQLDPQIMAMINKLYTTPTV